MPGILQSSWMLLRHFSPLTYLLFSHHKEVEIFIWFPPTQVKLHLPFLTCVNTFTFLPLELGAALLNAELVSCMQSVCHAFSSDSLGSLWLSLMQQQEGCHDCIGAETVRKVEEYARESSIQRAANQRCDCEELGRKTNKNMWSSGEQM